MGTVGNYTGGGGADGDALRDDLAEWLNALGSPPDDGPPEEPHDGQQQLPLPAAPRPPGPPKLDPASLLGAVGLFRPRTTSRSGGADGPGGGGGIGGRAAGGASRSAAAAAGTAGRAAAGAYAFATGDAETLSRLGLDYESLRSRGDTFEVIREIVDAAFESAPPDSSIPDHEQRLVAADVAEWVIEEAAAGQAPLPEDIVRKTIAAIIAQATLAETGDVAGRHAQGAVSEDEIREASEVLSSRAQLSVAGATEAEFAQAIEDGIETLRAIKDASRR